jgi:hypothetical protein
VGGRVEDMGASVKREKSDEEVQEPLALYRVGWAIRADRTVSTMGRQTSRMLRHWDTDRRNRQGRRCDGS